METSDKKVETQGIDRISHLSDDILLHILSFLEAEDAVRTTVLSRRWQCLWIYVPNLNFSVPISTSADEYNPKMQFLERVLTLHAAPKLHKFKLLCLDMHLGQRMELFFFSVTRKVEDLDLSLFPPHVLPQWFYYQDSLRVLRTLLCDFLPKWRTDWGSLKVLNTECASFEGIDNVLSGCPVLESLTLRGVRVSNNSGPVDIVHNNLKKLVIDSSWPSSNDQNALHVTTPQLEELEISGAWYWNSCKLIDIPSSAHICLHFFIASSIERKGENAVRKCQNAVKELLESARHSDELCDKNYCIKVLAKMEMNSLHATISSRGCLVFDVGLANLEH